MHELLEDNLDQIYPDFRSPLTDDSRVTSICETGDGWYPLLASLFEQLAALSRLSGVRFHARQIKEKFGTLRVYFDCTGNGGDQDVFAIASLLVSAAEFLSGEICEISGAPAKTSQVRSWIRTACEPHKSEITRPPDEHLIEQLLAAPRTPLDLSCLPPIGRIQKTDLDESRRYSLTLVRYRSMQTYAGVRLQDVELCVDAGLFDHHTAASESAKKFGCYWIESRP